MQAKDRNTDVGNQSSSSSRCKAKRKKDSMFTRFMFGDPGKGRTGGPYWPRASRGFRGYIVPDTSNVPQNDM